MFKYCVRFSLALGSILMHPGKKSQGLSLMLSASLWECKPNANFFFLTYTLSRRSYSQISSPVKFWSFNYVGNRALFMPAISLILIVLFILCVCKLKMMLFRKYKVLNNLAYIQYTLHIDLIIVDKINASSCIYF